MTNSVFSFYQNGYALGTVGKDSCRVVAELEYARVAGDNYMRLWLLYNNSSKTPFFLDPMKAARITTTVNHDTVEMVADTLEIVGGIAHVERQTQIVKVSDTLNFEPTPPFEIFASIDNQKTVATILQAIGGVAEAVGQKPTTITQKTLRQARNGRSTTRKKNKERSYQRDECPS